MIPSIVGVREKLSLMWKDFRLVCICCLDMLDPINFQVAKIGPFQRGIHLFSEDEAASGHTILTC